MNFKEFHEWCNERWSDDCWGIADAAICIDIETKITKMPVWKREKEWQKVASEICEQIVKPTNRMIEEMYKEWEFGAAEVEEKDE